MTNEQLLTYIRVKTHDLDKIACSAEDEFNPELVYLKKEIKRAIRAAIQQGLGQDDILQWAVRTYINFYFPNGLKEQSNSEQKFSLDYIISTRRSVRHFDLSKSISKGLILELINAGRWAPSACNRQPVNYMVLESNKSKEFTYNIRRDKTILRADKVIAILVDKRVYNNTEISYTPYLDTAAAIQNILLKVHELELGACWINFGVYECGVQGLERFAQNYNIPNYLSCVSLIALGYPAKKPRTVIRKNIDDIVSWQ